MLVFIDDGSTNIKLQWQESDGTIKQHISPNGTVAKLAMRQPFVLFKGLTFQKLCLPGAFRPGDHHNK
uniref:plasmid segregation protein ParM domain-containing protein n=2 Tax=Klebsiella pneumoniae TaxID=573 RepID=UPI003F79092C